MNLIPSEMSVEGAYDLAIEAAAGRIQMVSRDGVIDGSNGGYSSDGELSVASSSVLDLTAVDDPMIDLENSSLTDNSSSSGNATTSGSSDSSDDDDEINSEISYLKQKQQLLEKATFALKREEAYIALNAHSILSRANVPSKLWDEAKYFLDALQKDFHSIDDLDKRKESPVEESIEVFQSFAPPPKRPKIDLSMVDHVRAGAFPYIVTPLSAKPSIANDPMAGPTLDAALQFTSQAQIIAMPTPPFSVVYMNKAFCEFSGLDQADVIGKPVETILQVDQDFSHLLDGSVTPSQFLLTRKERLGSKENGCHLQVAPIMDYSRNAHTMTHILVKIEPLNIPVPAGALGSTKACSRALNIEKQIKEHADSQEKPASHKVTIG